MIKPLLVPACVVAARYLTETDIRIWRSLTLRQLIACKKCSNEQIRVLSFEGDDDLDCSISKHVNRQI
jgi:hypothetical protein